MLQLTPQLKIFVAIDAVDFRKGIDALMFICQHQLNQDPYSGAVFAFRNRSKSAVKLLVYDGQGFWLCLKRFSKGRLTWWPADSQSVTILTAQALQMILWNGDPTQLVDHDWRTVSGSALL